MRVTTAAPSPPAPPETAETPDEESEPSSAPPDSSADWQGSARYALERSLICPHCHEVMQSIKVIRLVRSQVPFTSTLPRAGRVLLCPSCEGMLSVELSGLI
jgi:hypothetical protein